MNNLTFTDKLHRSFHATREYMLPFAKLHPLTIGTKDNFRIQAIKAAIQDLRLPRDQWGAISNAYLEWREEEIMKSMREHGEEIELQSRNDYHPAEGEAHFYTNDAGHRPCPETGRSIPAEEEELDEDEGPCFECGEIINYREGLPCWNCNTI